MAKSKLSVGDKIPEFKLPNEKGEEQIISPNDGVKRVIYFYPKDNTKVCTAQACSFRDFHSDFIKQGYEVIGVSPDTVDKQNKFADKFGFKYNLLADDSRVLIDAFGVWGKKKFRGNEYEGVLRTTFIINEEGVIERIIDKVNTKEHTDQIID